MVIDVSVWVGYFLPQDKHHAATVSWLEALTKAGEALSVPTLLFPELAGAIARRSGSSELGIEAARQVLGWPLMELVPQDEALITLATQLAAELPVRGADSIYIAAAKLLGRSLITWDEEQLSRGSRIVATHLPKAAGQ